MNEDDNESQKSSSSIVLYGLMDEREEFASERKINDVWSNYRKFDFIPNRVSITE